MAIGICTNPACGKEVHWRGGRGCKIEDVRCPACGSAVSGKTKGMPGKNLGRKMDTCHVCGQRAYLFLRPTEDYRVVWPANGSVQEGRDQIHPAGSPCCDTHIPRPLDVEDNSNLEFRSAEWCRIENRKEMFLFMAAGRHNNATAKFREWKPDGQMEGDQR